jgi:hypothetical protein
MDGTSTEGVATTGAVTAGISAGDTVAVGRLALGVVWLSLPGGVVVADGVPEPGVVDVGVWEGEVAAGASAPGWSLSGATAGSDLGLAAGVSGACSRGVVGVPGDDGPMCFLGVCVVLVRAAVWLRKPDEGGRCRAVVSRTSVVLATGVRGVPRWDSRVVVV